MKLLSATLLLLTVASSLRSESRATTWTRRALTVAACAASALDGYDSAVYLGHNGLVESNPILAGPHGSVRVGRMIAFKAGICLGIIAAGELAPRPFKPAVTAVAAAELAAFTVTDIHNRRLIGSSK